MKSKRIALVLFVSTILGACAKTSDTGPLSLAWLDEPACTPEPVIVEPREDHFQYDGFDQDGNWLVVGYRRDGEPGAYRLNLNTQERIDIPKLNNVASFAPDGNTLVSAFLTGENQSSIVILDMTSNELENVAPSDSWDALPSFSPDGETIAFNSYRTGGSDIYTHNLETDALVQISNHPGNEGNAQFSPDGTKLVFHRDIGDWDFNILLQDIETGEITSLTSSPAEESYGSWSPDGKTIVFSSAEYSGKDKNDLFLMTSDGHQFRRLTQTDVYDTYPFFSRDGLAVYYNAKRDGEYSIYKIRLNPDLTCAE